VTSCVKSYLARRSSPDPSCWQDMQYRFWAGLDTSNHKARGGRGNAGRQGGRVRREAGISTPLCPFKPSCNAVSRHRPLHQRFCLAAAPRSHPASADALAPPAPRGQQGTPPARRSQRAKCHTPGRSLRTPSPQHPAQPGPAARSRTRVAARRRGRLPRWPAPAVLPGAAGGG
jgi:hypothetical protein